MLPRPAIRICLPLAIVLSLLAGMLSAPGADRREGKDPVVIPPPQPMAQKLKVERGQEIIIPLRIFGRKNQAVTFLIRKAPATGRLTGLKNTELEAAIVHYRPTDDRQVKTDRFEYAAKTTEGVSAAAVVEIEIIDQAAELVGVAEVLYPSRLVGTTETQTIELINKGGTTAEGTCEVSPPWRLDSPAEYRVEPGGRFFAKVTFMPDRTGDFLGDLRFSSQLDHPVVLRGIARSALAVQPATVGLKAELSTRVRAGVFEVTNNTAADLTLELKAGNRLRCPTELKLKPGETSPVVVRTEASDGATVQGQVVLRSGDYEVSVAVVGEALPAIIRATAGTLDFGPVPLGKPTLLELELRNLGGSIGWATVTAPPPFRVPSNKLTLAGGMSGSVPVTVESSDAGTIEQLLQIQTNNGTFTISARAVIGGSSLSSSAPASGTQTSRTSRPAADTASESTDAPLLMTVHDFDYEGKVDARAAVRTRGITETSAAIEWHTDLTPATTFIAERRELVMNGADLGVRWSRLFGFRVERQGEWTRGILDGLQAGHRYTVRIMTVKEDGLVGSMLAQTTFQTAPPAPRSKAWRWISGVAVVAIGAAGFLLWRRAPSRPATRSVPKTQKIF